MSTERVFAEDDLEALRRKYFPRIVWGTQGPVRRRYRTRAAEGQQVLQALDALARAEGFIGPGQRAVCADGDGCLRAMRQKGADESVAMVFGQGLDVFWCDLALGPVGADGWQEIVVRSEEAENLIALAHAVGALLFQKI